MTLSHQCLSLSSSLSKRQWKKCPRVRTKKKSKSRNTMSKPKESISDLQSMQCSPPGRPGAVTHERVCWEQEALPLLRFCLQKTLAIFYFFNFFLSEQNWNWGLDTISSSFKAQMADSKNVISGLLVEIWGLSALKILSNSVKWL